jgi:hypothetical protein
VIAKALRREPILEREAICETPFQGTPRTTSSVALAEAERVIEKTLRNALDLFHARGVINRAAIAKWLSGARDACWRVTDIVEREDRFVITIALPARAGP